MSQIARKASPLYAHEDNNLRKEIENIYRLLSELFMGPYRVFYNEADDSLYINYKGKNTTAITSIVKLTPAGNLTCKDGVNTGRTNFANVGTK